MSEFVGVVTTKGQTKIAASIGGTPLNLTTVRVGDGGGTAITPAIGMTDLVRRVGSAYPITASARDSVNPNYWRITALIPASEGPFDIREIGVFDAAGDMIAIARHVLVEKRSPAQGAAIELETDILFPVADTAQVTVAILTSEAVSLAHQLRAGWITVNSASLSAPPGAPAVGATYIVGAAPTGAWAGLSGYLVQWTGSSWISTDAPVGHLASVQDVAESAPGRYLKRTAAGWSAAAATDAAYGFARRCTAAELTAGGAGGMVTPADLASRLGAVLPAQATNQEAAAGANVSRWINPAQAASLISAAAGLAQPGKLVGYAFGPGVDPLAVSYPITYFNVGNHSGVAVLSVWDQTKAHFVVSTTSQIVATGAAENTTITYMTGSRVPAGTRPSTAGNMAIFYELPAGTTAAGGLPPVA